MKVDVIFDGQRVKVCLHPQPELVFIKQRKTDGHGCSPRNRTTASSGKSWAGVSSILLPWVQDVMSVQLWHWKTVLLECITFSMATKPFRTHLRPTAAGPDNTANAFKRLDEQLGNIPGVPSILTVLHLLWQVVLSLIHYPRALFSFRHSYPR